MKLQYIPVPKLATLGAAVLAAFLVACGQTPPRVPEPPKAAEKPKTDITEEARGALAQAEADVANARARFALWTTAESALNLARDAARAGDSPTVVKQAAIASEQARKGLDQLAYPGTELK